MRQIRVPIHLAHVTFAFTSVTLTTGCSPDSTSTNTAVTDTSVSSNREGGLLRCGVVMPANPTARRSELLNEFEYAWAVGDYNGDGVPDFWAVASFFEFPDLAGTYQRMALREEMRTLGSSMTGSAERREDNLSVSPVAELFRSGTAGVRVYYSPGIADQLLDRSIVAADIRRMANAPTLRDAAGNVVYDMDRVEENTIDGETMLRLQEAPDDVRPLLPPSHIESAPRWWLEAHVPDAYTKFQLDRLERLLHLAGQQ